MLRFFSAITFALSLAVGMPLATLAADYYLTVPLTLTHMPSMRDTWVRCFLAFNKDGKGSQMGQQAKKIPLDSEGNYNGSVKFTLSSLAGSTDYAVKSYTCELYISKKGSESLETPAGQITGTISVTGNF